MVIIATILLIQWIYLVVGALCIIPLTILLKYYRSTKVLDYLLFVGVFLSVIINQVFTFFQIDHPTNVFVGQVVASSYIWVYLFIFIHSLRLKWETRPKLLWYSGIIIYMTLQVLILFYAVVNIPERMNILFLELIRVGTENLGVGLKINGVIIMGDGYDYLISIYRIFTLIVAVFAYLSTEQVIKYKRIKIVRNLWVIVGFLTMGRPLLYLGDILSFWSTDRMMRSSFDLLAVIIIAYIVFQYPEGVLISEVQVTRASSLYNRLQEMILIQKKKEHGLDQIYNYLQRIPPELLNRELSEPLDRKG